MNAKVDDTEFRNSVAGQKLMALIADPKAGAAIGQALAELAVELADAIQEKQHWKRSFEAVKHEMKIFAGVALMRMPNRRVVVTRVELQSIPTSLDLHSESPEDGVRIYELRERQPEPKQSPLRLDS